MMGMIILMMIELRLMKLLTVKKRKVSDVRVGRNGFFYCSVMQKIQ